MIRRKSGVKTGHVPWAEPRGRYTLLFEAFAVQVLQAAATGEQARIRLRPTWESVRRIMDRAVEAVAMDMWPAFETSATKNVPQAEIGRYCRSCGGRVEQLPQLFLDSTLPCETNGMNCWSVEYGGEGTLGERQMVRYPERSQASVGKHPAVF